MKKLIIGVLCAVLLTGFAGQAIAQAKSENPAAVAKYDEGVIARQNKELEKALQAFEAAITIDPAYGEAHAAFIAAKRALFQSVADADKKKGIETQGDPFNLANRELSAFYQKKIAETPNVAVLYMAYGTAIRSYDSPNATKAFRKALELNPKLIEAYESLASLAWRVFDSAGNRENQKKAWELDPDSPLRIYRYGLAELDVDKASGRKMLRGIADRFPKDQYAVIGMGAVADSYEDEPEKTKVLEEMRARFMDTKVANFPYRMSNLFGIYTRRDLSKATQLAEEMLRRTPDSKEWKANVEFTRNIAEARRLIESSKFEEAAALLGATKAGSGTADLTEFSLLKAQAANDDAAAYASLIEPQIKSPNKVLEEALAAYGKKLGKTPQAVDEDLWQARVAKSKPLKDFDLAVFPLEQKKQLSLASLRNKVVLVNFWFPGCGACRYEFPHFEEMLKKYRSKGFEIVALNIVAEEDNEVMPFVKQSGYSFIPLQTQGAKWVRENYGVSLAPTNMLIDGEGRIMFQPIIVDDASAAKFERQIEILLARLKK